MPRFSLAVCCVLVVGCGGAEFESAITSDAGPIEATPSIEATRDGGESEAAVPDDVMEAAPSARADVASEADTPEASPEAGSCVTDLSDVGVGDFRIAFSLTTTDMPASYMALLDQRFHCDDTKPGWDVWMTAAGDLGIEVFDGAAGPYDNIVHDGRIVNDGATHRVVVSRSGATIAVGVDGVVRDYPEPVMSLGTLESLDIGKDPMCTGVGPMSGVLTDVCLLR